MPVENKKEKCYLGLAYLLKEAELKVYQNNLTSTKVV